MLPALILASDVTLCCNVFICFDRGREFTQPCYKTDILRTPWLAIEMAENDKVIKSEPMVENEGPFSAQAAYSSHLQNSRNLSDTLMAEFQQCLADQTFVDVRVYGGLTESVRCHKGRYLYDVRKTSGFFTPSRTLFSLLLRRCS